MAIPPNNMAIAPMLRYFPRLLYFLINLSFVITFILAFVFLKDQAGVLASQPE
jgi:hypothetical protein